MAKRSLTATDAGIRKAKQVFQRTGWTQSEFAMEIGLSTRQPIWKFFSGRAVERSVFVDICFRLDLDWEEIAGVGQFALATGSSSSGVADAPSSSEDHPLLEMIRNHLRPRLQGQYQWMPVSLDLPCPLPLCDSYVPATVWLLPRLLRNRSACSLAQTSELSLDPWERMDWFDAVQQHPKLILQGRMGSGKTTALRWLGQACLDQNILAHRLPITLQLSGDLAFLEQLEQQWQAYGLSSEQLVTLSQRGHLLLLLDGFDRLPEAQRHSLRNQIEQWNQQYPENAMVLSCRPSCDEAHFYDFTVVELASLRRSQLKTFVERWFANTSTHLTQTSPRGQTQDTSIQAQQFLTELEHTTWSDRELTPLILHHLCLWFLQHRTLLRHTHGLHQTLLELLLFRWGRVSGYGGPTAPLSEALLESLTQVAINGIPFPHNPYGLTQLTCAGEASGAMRLGEAWSESQAQLRLLYQDYGFLEMTRPGQYRLCDADLQIYLCALYYSNPQILQASFSSLLQSIAQLPFEAGLNFIQHLLNLSPTPSLIIDLIFNYGMLRLQQHPELEELVQWLTQKSTQSISQTISPNFVQAFYYLMARPHASTSLLNHFSSEWLSSLPPELQRDLYWTTNLTQLQRSKAESGTWNQAIAANCRWQIEALCSQELHTIGPPQTEADSLDDAWMQGLIDHAWTHYGLGQTWPWPEVLEQELQAYDQTLVTLMVALQGLDKSVPWQRSNALPPRRGADSDSRYLPDASTTMPSSQSIAVALI